MQGPIPPSRFYDGRLARKFVPPALQEKNREAILAWIRRNPKLLMHDFPTQQQAFAFVDKHPTLSLQVFSYEKDGQGTRGYRTATYRGFWRKYKRWLRCGYPLHFYEVIREGSVCKLYFDLEYNRKANKTKKPERMIGAIVEEVERRTGKKDLGMVMLDSTTDKKFSRHLVFENVAFVDYVSCGVFVREVVAAIAERNREDIYVRKSVDTDEVTTFVDQAVYTKNRCFRLVLSSKFGRRTPLLPIARESGSDDRKRRGVSEELFLRSLVCNVSETCKPLNFGTQCRQRGCNAKNRSLVQGYEGQSETSNSPFPDIDSYIRSFLGIRGGCIYRSMYFRASQVIVYSVKGNYRFCANIGRHHRSNNIMLCVDLVHREVYQRCHDPDCWGFRSEGWLLPRELLAGDDGEESKEFLTDDAILSALEEYEESMRLTQGSKFAEIKEEEMAAGAGDYKGPSARVETVYLAPDDPIWAIDLDGESIEKRRSRERPKLKEERIAANPGNLESAGADVDTIYVAADDPIWSIDLDEKIHWEEKGTRSGRADG